MTTIQPTAFSDQLIGSLQRQRIEDHARDARVTTPGGLDLQLGIVCDGVGSSDWGVIASTKATDVIFESIRTSSETDIPALLTEAVQAANRELLTLIPSRQGNTTVALLAIHLNDPSAPFGRLFIACVGDSLIYIARTDPRTRQTVIDRLNRDHNVETDVRRGEMTDSEAGDSAPSDITRALGLRRRIEVDIGFYRGESEKKIIPTEVAEDRGHKGLKLQEGDMVFACSDGVRDLHPDGQPYLTDEKIIRHALDVDVMQTVKSLLSYPVARETTDNVSMSVIFIPSKKLRRGNYVQSRLPRGVLIGGAALILVIAAIAAIVISRSGSQVNALERTSTAVAVVATQTRGAEFAVATDARSTQSAIESYTPTPTITLTPTFTPSPTLVPTARPVFEGVANNVGSVAIINNAPQPIVPGTVFIAPDTASAQLDGGESRPDPALLYFSQSARLTLDSIDNASGLVAFEM
ncbi:MAG: protein phosphatase 2C domain-containing protein, partial [Chloroflexota bacterium]|nr:protein phosphatase 2C domain-containing protein [Chloroflexota bacterium]